MKYKTKQIEKRNKENPDLIDVTLSTKIPGTYLKESPPKSISLKKYQENYEKIKWK
jgi:hypothetical protein